MKRIRLEVLLIFVPLIYGYIASKFIIVIHPFVIQLIFGAFWLWVGLKFGRMALSKFKSILIGNSIWLISFLVFIWQFILIDEVSRNVSLAIFSQYYILPYIWVGTKVAVLFTDTINSSTVMLLSYLCMLVTFLIGYLLSSRKR